MSLSLVPALVPACRMVPRHGQTVATAKAHGRGGETDRKGLTGVVARGLGHPTVTPY